LAGGNDPLAFAQARQDLRPVAGLAPDLHFHRLESTAVAGQHHHGALAGADHRL
jgi:hypothetical protein